MGRYSSVSFEPCLPGGGCIVWMGGARLYLVGADISGSKKKLFARVRRLKSQAEAIERALDGETGYKRGCTG